MGKMVETIFAITRVQRIMEANGIAVGTPEARVVYDICGDVVSRTGSADEAVRAVERHLGLAEVGVAPEEIPPPLEATDELDLF